MKPNLPVILEILMANPAGMTTRNVAEILGSRLDHVSRSMSMLHSRGAIELAVRGDGPMLDALWKIAVKPTPARFSAIATLEAFRAAVYSRGFA